MKIEDFRGRDREQLTKIDAFEELVENVGISSRFYGPRGVPGEVVAAMPQRVREKLKELKSEDLEEVVSRTHGVYFDLARKPRQGRMRKRG